MTAGGTTPTHGLPWPDGAAAADGSADIKALAEATDRELVEHDTAIAAKSDVQAMDDLTDVAASAPSDGQALIWNQTSGVWNPATVSSGGGTLPAAGAGLTGGATSYEVGAGIGITANVDDIAINRAVTDTWYEATGAVAAHEAAADPHTQYATDTDLAGKENVGVAAGLITTHEAAADPHTQYLTQTEANPLYSPTTHAHSLDDLSNVTAAAPTDGQALIWNQGAATWNPATVSSGGGTLPAAGAGLTGGTASYDVIAAAGGGIVVNADDIAVDRTVTDAWYAPAGQTHTLDSLTDVDTTTVAPVTGDGLVFDGTIWIPGVGSETLEVVAGSVAPATPSAGRAVLWVDPAQTIPGGAGTDHGTLVGLGDDDHPQYILGAGDVMTGQLGLVAPTLIGNAARWADGVPRFADVAARDAAYATIGGPVAGMQCYVTAKSQGQQYHNGLWLPVTGSLPRAHLVFGDFSVPSGWNFFNNGVPTNTDTDSYSATGSTITTLIPGTFTLSWSVNISGFDMVRLIPAVAINGDYGNMHMWGSTVAGPTFVQNLLLHGYLDAVLPANTTLELWAFSDPPANVTGAGTRLVAEYRHP